MAVFIVMNLGGSYCFLPLKIFDTKPRKIISQSNGRTIILYRAKTVQTTTSDTDLHKDSNVGSFTRISV